MPLWSDPAPCDDDEQLYECTECGTRLCSEVSPTTCEKCGAEIRNISVPRPE
jgi:ABC-type ATPase with predicted acetyltransferase domain